MTRIELPLAEDDAENHTDTAAWHARRAAIAARELRYSDIAQGAR